MSEERPGLIQFGGVDKTIIGPDIAVGQGAPDFIAVAGTGVGTHLPVHTNRAIHPTLLGCHPHGRPSSTPIRLVVAALRVLPAGLA